MAGSSTSVNYNLRPCKSVERKMMCEIISRLTPIQAIDKYRYIGMGAKYFADFSLIHKKFGITQLYSMEIDSAEETKNRFNFNKPFNCINMVYGNSSDLLNSNKFTWKNKKSIIWLDYDGGIKSKQLQDVETCVSKLESGSLVFITFNDDLGEAYLKGSPKDKLEIFSKRVGNDDLLKLITPKDLAGDRFYSTIATIFSIMINNKISERNQTILNDDEKLSCDQMIYFKYADSKAEMLTIGWIVYSQSEAENVKRCEFDKLDFFNNHKLPYDISIPNFTYKELAVLNRNLPNISYPIQEAKFISEEEIKKYKQIYRYYPTTFETNIAL